MKPKPANRIRWFDPLVGAAVTTLCGLFFAYSVVGEFLVNASYDYLSRFSTRAITNQVEIILMDNEAFHHFGQERGQPWDRGLHAQLLNRLADDGAAMVVVDALFGLPRDPATDEALAAAIRRQRHIVLMARQIEVSHPSADAVRPELPDALFLEAAKEQWGVAWLNADIHDEVVRQHWPFPAPGPHPSLPEAAAVMLGAELEREPHERWLRYYGPRGAWPSLSYPFALNQPTNYYRDKIVFIGTNPATSVPGDGEVDEFSTPYTARTGESIGGVQIMMTSFLNLLNHDWLRRLPVWLEVLVFLGFGALAALLCRLSPKVAALLALGAFVLISLGAVSWSHFSNNWFPWLVVSGGQVPCALVCALIIQWIRTPEIIPEVTSPVVTGAVFETPDAPDYELLNPPFGKGAYGKVWLARNVSGQWQALKAVYLSNFDDEGPYEREFNGIQRYKPISDKHPGLLRVDFVSQKKPSGYFYYVMELGDPLEGGWEKNPMTYKPRDLFSERQNLKGKKLPILEALRIGITLADALAFLHRQGLTHRDIKPQNVIFVNGRPKLADLGLIAEVRPEGQKLTYVGTPGYMPPPPESPGTPQADICALGMLLYVLMTGRSPKHFPELSTILAADTKVGTFFELNPIILKACEPDLAQRYASADEFLDALKAVEKVITSDGSDSSK